MPNVELIFDADCPHVEAAREQIRRAFRELDQVADWQEWDRRALSSPGHTRFYGSPTILVDGKDVAGVSPSAGVDCCRVYRTGDDGLQGVPPLASIVVALRMSARHNNIGGLRSSLAVLPAIGVGVRDGVCFGFAALDFVKIGSCRFFVKLDRTWEFGEVGIGVLVGICYQSIPSFFSPLGCDREVGMSKRTNAARKDSPAKRTNDVSPQAAVRLAEMAREMRQLVYGEQAYPQWGTKFTEIESEGMNLGLELARMFMEQSVSEQAEHVPDDALECDGEAAERGSETKNASLETAAGEVAWEQPQTRLPKSKRAFFPSGEEFGG